MKKESTNFQTINEMLSRPILVLGFRNRISVALLKATVFMLFAFGVTSKVDAQTYAMTATSGSATTCAGTLYDSGGAGGDYTNSQDRTFTINPATAGQFIRLIFSALTVETCCDFVQVYDGPTTASPLIGQYTTIPPTLTSTHASGALTIRFFSDGSITGAGFAAAISCVSPTGPSYAMTATSGSATTCAGTIYDSGGAAGDYTSSQDRTFTINPATAGQSIRLIFSALAVETCCDFVQVYNGPTTASPLLGQYTTIPPTLTSTHASGALTIRFFSDGSITGAGFAAAISCVAPTGPSYSMTATSGSATTCAGTLYDSGGAGGIYTASESRTFVINPATAGSMSRLTLTSIDLESCCDYIQIYNGPSTASPLLVQLAGNVMPAITNYTSSHSTGALTVFFLSDGSVQNQGFSASISCVTPTATVNINACTGTFLDSGGAGANYANNEISTYTICPNVAGSKSTVQFTSFNLENGKDFMYVYDGNSVSAPLLGMRNE